ncbi:TrkH family potassium uptake protein [[Mycoplasma] gypis]|uniref:Potassium transporter TrkG n=1 Tax=[Mycoplasma] gypis TaxID=92404 RepID=A0ABZ2RNX4_9BACT|nr:potassium transporter TrkG [[Mycoplasma] gypis]
MGKIKYIFLTYLIITFTISILLYFPITHATKNPSYNYSDALFIAASAFSDTGLSTVTVSEQYNIFGQTVIAIAIIIGGFGFFTIKLYIFELILSRFGIKMSSHKVSVTQLERGSTVTGDTKKLIKVSLTTLIITILVGSFVLFFYFFFSNQGFFLDETNPQKQPNDVITFFPYQSQIYNPHGDWKLSLRYAFFHSISAVNNAGFDIIGGNSINLYYKSKGLQLILIALFFIGGVGYPTIYDVYKKIVALFRRQRNRVSLFTKLNLTTWLVVSVLGIILTIIFETTSGSSKTFWMQKEYGSTWDKLFAIFFNTLSTRSAGFSTVDYYSFTQPTQIIHAILMFIGFAPASTAGGIRNLTLSIIFISVFSVIKGRKNVVAFSRQIGKETLIKAINIFIIGLSLIFIGTLIVSTSAKLSPEEIVLNDGTTKIYGMTQVFFEVCSAFGSSGLSAGITDSLNLASKITLIFLMFIGQLGITSTILVWGRQKSKELRISNIREDVSLG